MNIHLKSGKVITADEIKFAAGTSHVTLQHTDYSDPKNCGVLLLSNVDHIMDAQTEDSMKGQ
jgi:hypothetical protein